MKSETSRYKADGPLALILAPTRELVVQIAKECDKFGKDSFILSNAIFGGVPKGPQVGIPLRDWTFWVSKSDNLMMVAAWSSFSNAAFSFLLLHDFHSDMLNLSSRVLHKFHLYRFATSTSCCSCCQWLSGDWVSLGSWEIESIWDDGRLSQFVEFWIIQVLRDHDQAFTPDWGSSVQIRFLRESLHILIATPGRLNDFMETGIVKLSSVEYLVLDEAVRNHHPCPLLWPSHANKTCTSRPGWVNRCSFVLWFYWNRSGMNRDQPTTSL